jgi:hypothetical protein
VRHNAELVSHLIAVSVVQLSSLVNNAWPNCRGACIPLRTNSRSESCVEHDGSSWRVVGLLLPNCPDGSLSGYAPCRHNEEANGKSGLRKNACPDDAKRSSSPGIRLMTLPPPGTPAKLQAHSGR